MPRHYRPSPQALRLLPHRTIVALVELLFIAASGLFLAGCQSQVAGSAPPAHTPPASPETLGQVGAPPGVDSVAQAESRARAYPNDAESQLILARTARMTKPAVAARAYRDALRLNPASTAAFTELLALYDEKGYTDRALELCESRLKAQPRDVRALTRAAEILADIGADGIGANYLDRALAAAPDSTEAALSRAQYHYRFREFKPAVDTLRAVVSRQGTNPSLRYTLSEYLRGQEKFEEAEEQIREAIKLKPNEGVYHRQLAHILVTSEKPARLAEAETEARRAVELGDRDIDARYWLALALERQRKIPESIRAWEEVAKEDAQYEMTAFRLGRLYQQNGKAKEGSELLRLFGEMERNRSQFTQALRNLRKEPARIENYLALARRFPPGQDGLAVATLRRGLARFPANPALTALLRDTLSACGRDTEAARLATRTPAK